VDAGSFKDDDALRLLMVFGSILGVWVQDAVCNQSSDLAYSSSQVWWYGMVQKQVAASIAVPGVESPLMFIGQTHVTVVDVDLTAVQFSLPYHVVCRSRCVMVNLYAIGIPSH
jgi:hypothetical protein